MPLDLVHFFSLNLESIINSFYELLFLCSIPFGDKCSILRFNAHNLIHIFMSAPTECIFINAYRFRMKISEIDVIECDVERCYGAHMQNVKVLHFVICVLKSRLHCIADVRWQCVFELFQ